MANHRSAAKRARQTGRKTVQNTMVKKSVRSSEKKLRTAIANKDSANVDQLLKDFTSSIAKMAQKGIVHLKTASRKISRLSSQVKSLSK